MNIAAVICVTFRRMIAIITLMIIAARVAAAAAVDAQNATTADVKKQAPRDLTVLNLVFLHLFAIQCGFVMKSLNCSITQ